MRAPGPRGIACALASSLGFVSAGCTTEDVVAMRRPGGAGNSLEGVTDAEVPVAAASADAGPSPEPCAALYCADFEAPIDESAVDGTGAELARDCGRARSGSCSLSASAVEPGGYAVLTTPLSAPASLYLRAYVWVPSALPLTDIALFQFGTGGETSGLVVDLRGGDRYEVFLPEDAEPLLSEPGSITKDAWVCLQLAVQVGDVDGTVELRADGSVVVSATGVDNHPASGLGFFTLGIDWSSEEQELGGIWLDDVVLDDSPVPCL